MKLEEVMGEGKGDNFHQLADTEARGIFGIWFFDTPFYCI